MAIDIPARVAFLKKISLFYGLEDKDLEIIAAKFKELVCPPGYVVFKQDSKADGFYMIYKGKVRITRKEKEKEKEKETQLSILVDKDYFGEGGMTSRSRRLATVTVLSDTILLLLERKELEEMFKKYHQLRTNMIVTVQSRRLARTTRFKWMGKDETIYFIARKHPIVLIISLILPLLTLTIPLACLYGYYYSGPYFLFKFIGISSFIGALGWIAWRIIDWGNDYYIVTNERAVWLEKVVGFYDSRQETPISMILSVNEETSFWGRLFDYGDVQIRTFVGQIVFNEVNHPVQARHIIEEYWNRSKDQNADIEKDAIKNAIRKQLGLSVPGAPKPDSKPTAPIKPIEKTPSGLIRMFSSNRINLRYETEDSVVYRKHWVVLFLGSWIPFTGAIVFFTLFVLRTIKVILSPDLQLFSIQNSTGLDSRVLIYFLAFIPFAIWAAYIIADWSNDKYEVTNEQIIDTNKKPLGTEVRKVSELANILGTSYERKGLLGNIFNFGTVHIQVGASLLDFENVLDPATVQSDVDRRRMAYSNKQKQDKINSERDRMAGWLATYHRNAKGFYSEQDTGETKPQ